MESVNQKDSQIIQATFWQGRRVFVTGATGIVGSWLVKELLALGAYVVALVRDADPQSEFLRSGDSLRTFVVNGRLEDYATLERAINEHEIEAVFHLAAQPIVGVAQRSPLQTFEANIRGSYNLLEACRVHSGLVKRVVIASSDKAYGTQPNLPYTEQMPLQGQYPYEVSKSCTDLITQSYYLSYGLPVAIARCGNIYGGGDLNWNRIVPGTIRSVLRGERPVIRSDGQSVRDYFYVEDGAAAYMMLAERLASDANLYGEAFNFSNELQVTVLELVNRVLSVMGSNTTPDVRNEASNEIRHQYLSAAKARQQLEWAPLFTLDGGLQNTIRWYEDFFTHDV